MTERLEAEAPGLARAADLLRAGQLVAFPTETVYGLGGDARQGTAVAGIYAAKGRPQFNPLIVHVADMAMAEQVAIFSDQARALAARFWPGPLTLVLPARPEAGISDLVTAGLPTVAVRMPAHPVARARCFWPLAGLWPRPRPTPSGKVSPTEADHVLEGLSGRIAAVVDGGACPVGVESTILGLDPPMLLRPGGVDVETLEEMLGQPLAFGGDAVKPNAPGQLVSHYAPGAAVRLEATNKQPGEIYLGFGPGPEADLTLSAQGNLIEAATKLFAMLRVADKLASARGAATIAIAPIPETGLGRAINDRLRRAAAPRG
ncbi:L-threonylcarbamoyladenylate synthase [Rhodobacter capsulatus]|uniref:L-threonylcarbamoyladenylate synthase n=1 Tax=Rhodobacter capsulatus TaxID=1061 RepID=UPI0040267394